MKRYYCTYFDRNYALKAIALIESLIQNERNDFTLYAVCMDEVTHILLRQLNLPNVKIIPMHAIERGDAELQSMKKNRSIVEYYWTTTPSIILNILNRYEEIDILTYLDADLYFYSSPDPIFEELDSHSILIHEHRFSPSMAYLGKSNGKYNVGLLSFRNDDAGILALQWWRERCLEWCFNRYEDGKMGDQMYLDDWPTRFENVVVLKHLGAGVGPWNHDQYQWSVDESGRVFVNGEPLIFYHFHAFSFLSPDLILPVKHSHYPLTLKTLRSCYVPYSRALFLASRTIQGIWPEFKFGSSEQGNVTEKHTFLAKRTLAEKLQQAAIPHRRIELDSTWDCYCSEQVRDADATGEHCPESRNGQPLVPLANDNPHWSAEQDEAQLTGKPQLRSSQDSAPRISVIVSTYNSEAFIQEALEDLERQTIANQLEIIVVDAASPQNEKAIVEEFQQRYHNIVYLRTPTRIGVYAAWNLALKIAQGEYATPMSTNDRLRAEAYEILAQHLDTHPDVTLVYGDTYLTELPHETFEQHTRCGVWRWPSYRYEDLLRNCRVGPHPMWRKAVHDSIGYFDEGYIALGDQEFWLRMGESHKLLHVEAVTGLYWWSSDGLSTRLEISQPEEARIRTLYLERYSRRLPQDKRLVFDCSIIIPVFNKCELTTQCLTALAQVTNETAWEVVVIDNASTDDTSIFLKSLGGDVCVIRNEENVGFAKACNQGAQAARGRYLVFLNNDTIPLEGWLKALVDEVEANPDVAVVGSQLLYPNDTVQHAGVVFSRAGSIPYHLYNGFPGNVSAVNRRRELQAVTGACMLVRRAVFEAIGGFDEEYRNGFEDIDFCLKVRDRGERIIYQPKSILYHLESQTPGRKDYDAENMQRFLERWKDRWLADEDSVYVPDGYAIHEVQEDSRRIYRVANLEDAQALARWKLVAEVERQSQVGNMEAVRSSLAQPDLWPDDPGVLRWAAQICDRADVPARAEAFWRRALDFGVTPEVLVALTRNALEKGALDEAEQHIQGLITQNPTDGEGWLLQGILALQRQDFVTAKVAFENALRSSNNPRKARKGLGMATMGLNQMETAWDMFATVLADEIDDAETIHSLLRVGTALERWEPLAEHLAKYLKLNPGELSVRFALAGVHTRLGNMGAARQEYDTIRMLNPTFEGLDDLAMVLGCMPDVQAPLVNLLNAS